MFQQSKIIADLNWKRFAEVNNLKEVEDVEHVTFKIPSITDDALHSTLFELDTAKFHKDLWQACEVDPITTIYSAVWTLCCTLPPPMSLVSQLESKDTSSSSSGSNDTTRDVSPSDYYSSWYPFILLHRYIYTLRNRYRKNPEKEIELFTVEQLIEADKQYLAALNAYKRPNDTIDNIRADYERHEIEYLTSPMFIRMSANTPYGTVERNEYDQVRYVRNLANVDPRRMSSLFHRVQAYEPLRSQCEQTIRQLFDNRFHLNVWLFPMLYDVEDQVDSWKTVTIKDRRYVMYWQYQKSELVWFVLHTLFALNRITHNDEHTFDLLYFVSNYLKKFIECGMCLEHWKNDGMPLFQSYETMYTSQAKQWKDRLSVNEKSNNTTSLTQQHQRMYNNLTFTILQDNLDYVQQPPDMFMLHMHNSVQSKNVSSSKQLTSACIRSLRNDYTYYAMLIEASSCFNNDDVSGSTYENRVSQIFEIARTRIDILTDACHIFTSDMLYYIAVVRAQNKEEASKSLIPSSNEVISPSQRCELYNERRSLESLITGKYSV